MKEIIVAFKSESDCKQALNDIGYEDVFSFEISNPYYQKFPEIDGDMLPILHKLYVELGRAILRVK